MKGITLIGMPGSGKSTIGKLLAEKLNWKFVDLDILIKEKEGRGHEKILEQDGEQALLGLEEKYTLEMDLDKVVLSPGGSIVYSLAAMEKLQKETKIVYLELQLTEIKIRLGDQINSRGIIGLKEKGLEKLFEERHLLYQNFSHFQFNCNGLNSNEIASKIYSNILENIRID